VLDLKRIRDDPDGVRAALARRGDDAADAIDELLSADAQWREATGAAERLRSEQKTRSEEFGAAKARGEDAPQLRAAMQELSTQVKQHGERATSAKERLDTLVARLPNLPDPTAADGPEDELVKTVGEPPAL
jgi:seryl-tRNA synthetase